IQSEMPQMSLGCYAALGSSGIAAAPAESTRALIHPAITRDHLVHPHDAKAEEAKRQANRVVDHVIVQGQKRAVEQRIMQEAHRKRERQHIESDVPPWPPCCGNGAASKPGAATAEKNADQEKNSERMLVGNQLRNRNAHLN